MITWNPNVKYAFVTGTYLDNKSKRQCQRWGIVLSVSLFMWSPTPTVGMRIFQMEGDARLQWFTPLFPQTDLFAGAAAEFKTKWQCGLYRLYCTVSLLDIITPFVFPSSIFSWPHCFCAVAMTTGPAQQQDPTLYLSWQHVTNRKYPLSNPSEYGDIKTTWNHRVISAKLWFVSIICFCRHVFHWTVDWWFIGDAVKKKILILYLYRKHL